MAVKKLKPRGLRNNNPLNIRIGNAWLGEVLHPTDLQFEQFIQIEYGIRAGFVLLRRYIKRYKLNTVPAIISRWAPENENATQNYINSVCKLMNVSCDTILVYENKEIMCKLVDAMIRIECGEGVLMAKINKGYNMA